MNNQRVIIGPNETDIKHTEKSDISEFNMEEIRGWIIDELNKIEQKIDRIITVYFNPEKKQEFTKIILNSSIVSTGAKMKILRNIDSFDKNKISKIQTVISIRNAFAHLPVTKSATVVYKNENGKLIGSLENVSTQLDIMNSNGEIKKKNVKELIFEYKKTVDEITIYLNDYEIN